MLQLDAGESICSGKSQTVKIQKLIYCADSVHWTTIGIFKEHRRRRFVEDKMCKFLQLYKHCLSQILSSRYLVTKVKTVKFMVSWPRHGAQ